MPRYRDSVLDYINLKEGQDESTDDGIHKQVEDYIDDIMNGSSDDSETEDDSPKKRLNRPRMRDNKHHGDKVEFSEDEDAEAAYNAFKQRKTAKRKRTAAEVKVARGPRKPAEDPIVGKRRKRQTPTVLEETSSKKQRASGEIDESDDDKLMDGTLPDYIKNRIGKFDKVRAKLGEAGLSLPPQYNDIDFSDDERMHNLAEKPVLPKQEPKRPYEDISMPLSAGIIPAPIAQWLRDYQVKGVEFLHELLVWQRGGILGDDMGLGKTIQVIAFLTAAFGKTGDERDQKRMRKIRRAGDSRWYPRALIICPGSLMENWKAELKKWGWWTVYVYHGAEKEAALQAAKSGRLELLITTYTTYKKNKSAINTVDWDVVIADECHQIKSRKSEITQAMNDINALCRIGLTGTAIQNNYEELWTLLNWTNPGTFGSLSSWKFSISEPLKAGQAHDADYHQLARARSTAKQLVQNLLPQFFLRRMKTLIADQLPKKSDRVVFCPLTSTQSDAYENYVDSPLIEYIRTSSDPCDCNSGKKRGWCCYELVPGFGRWQLHVFPCMVILQKLANHLAQLIPVGTDNRDKQDRDLENLRFALPDHWRDLYREKDSILNFANQEFCGKWKILKKLLAFWHTSGDKVLVFSHSVRLLKMLQLLFASTTSYSVSYLDGAMSYEDRQRTVDDFNASPDQFVFLISTRAGGVGLNITSANKVVIVDPNWNPSYDLQAQDRAYRIGQTRDVEVFRLVSAGTIEEIMYARQIYKQQQANIGYNASLERRYFRGVQDDKGKKGEIFGLVNLFAYQGDNVVLRDIVNKTNVAESKAGVSVVDIELRQDSDNEGDDDYIGGQDEDAVMSQLAELIASGDTPEEKAKRPKGTKKMDAVQAILAGAGVEYTHENSEVIGTSKIESKLSRRAEEFAGDIDTIGKRVFTGSQSQSQSQGQGGRRQVCGNSIFGEAFDDDEEEEIDAFDNEEAKAYKKNNFKYHPPEDVRNRQFCTMAETFGFENPTEFALVVEGWTQAQRRNCLEKFYRIRRENGFKDKVKKEAGTAGDLKMGVEPKGQDAMEGNRKEEKIGGSSVPHKQDWGSGKAGVIDLDEEDDDDEL
ncbi:putative DNA excision repair protein [Aulographum hederae CBS 113979]|uniref:Putative DNA excision repair protein n=1 Tax=Aulographum hederae CBS 113979 TaxID=1176131 RepID=A0A6G1GNK6_9PEZI|nr:putative DNA excision repair protein [Aulographum hederae CBS 113979]